MAHTIGFICGGSSFHPYECSHDKYCEHCTLAKTSWHNPKDCGLCDSLPEDHPDKATELTEPMVKEPFATRIRVEDYSHRKLKILVNQAAKMPQVELPF